MHVEANGDVSHSHIDIGSHGAQNMLLAAKVDGDVNAHCSDIDAMCDDYAHSSDAEETEEVAEEKKCSPIRLRGKVEKGGNGAFCQACQRRFL